MNLAGIVEAVGPGASRLKLGEEVLAALTPWRADGGAQAEHVGLPEASAIAILEGTPLGEAATLPIVAGRRDRSRDEDDLVDPTQAIDH